MKTFRPLAGLALCLCTAVLPLRAQQAPAPAPDDEFSRTRQKLMEQLQSLNAVAPPTPAPAPAATIIPAAATAVVEPAPAPPASLGKPSATTISKMMAAGIEGGGGFLSTGLSDGEAAELMKSLDDKRKLSMGDKLSYRVYEDREDARPLFVTDSGEVEVVLAGRIKATDKTCAQLAKEIKTVLEKDFYHRATVVIGVDQLAKTRGKVYLYGQVRTPGALDLPTDEVLTVSKLILRAQGFADFANKRKVRVTRKGADGLNVIYVIDCTEVLEKGRSDLDLDVQADDMIFVPQRLINL
ncbi:MAG: SLBB domain-containing protein [Verrucomicrobia bacterium]|nr:SLBB domain-containing protein [Verrucomicrobiota bacterium]